MIHRVRPHVGCRRQAVAHVVEARDRSDVPDVAIAEAGLPVAPVRIGRRRAYPDAFGLGLAVFEVKSPDPKAAAEIEALHDYLFAIEIEIPAWPGEITVKEE